MSHPVWVRGLKQRKRPGTRPVIKVAPRVGAWIETYGKDQVHTGIYVCRTPCGCVD